MLSEVKSKRNAIHKDSVIKYVNAEDYDAFIQSGWLPGTGVNQKGKSKRWYNNGISNILLEGNQLPPEGYELGMCKHTGSFSSYKYHWYTNGEEAKRIKEGDSIPEGWIKGQSNLHKQKNKQANTAILKINNKPYSELYKSLYHNKDASIKFMSENDQKFTFKELTDHLNCSINSMMVWLKEFDLYSYIRHDNSISEGEESLYTFIQSIYKGPILRHDRTLISPKELDIYLPDLKLAFEFNGLYWHSIAWLKDKRYHELKSKACEDKGVRLIHIYEDEWKSKDKSEIIKSLIKIALKSSSKRIYARQCQVRKISNKEAKRFNDLNHLQRHRNAQITYGLYYNDILVQLMSFSYDKRKDWWEIIRGCPGSNNVVVGGVSKLFKHFIKENNVTKVFSYCDFNKFDGRGYEAIGMKFIGYTGPDKKYILNDRLVNRNPYKRKLYDVCCDGVVWGAGSKKYLWVKE